MPNMSPTGTNYYIPFATSLTAAVMLSYQCFIVNCTYVCFTDVKHTIVPIVVACAFELYVLNVVGFYTHFEYTSSYSDIEVCECVCIMSSTTLFVVVLVQVVSMLVIT